MKKLQFKILFFIFTSIILFSCELVDGEKEVTIQTNPFPSDVKKVHVAVLDGEDVLSQKVYEQEDVNEDGAIEIYTTPGADRTFVVVAEDDQGYASHFASDTVDIDNDGKAVVELTMREAIWERGSVSDFNVEYDPDNYILSWESTGIPNTRYIIYCEKDDIYRYDGYDNILNSAIDISGNDHNLTAVFNLFNLKTDDSKSVIHL